MEMTSIGCPFANPLTLIGRVEGTAKRLLLRIPRIDLAFYDSFERNAGNGDGIKGGKCTHCVRLPRRLKIGIGKFGGRRSVEEAAGSWLVSQLAN